MVLQGRTAYAPHSKQRFQTHRYMWNGWAAQGGVPLHKQKTADFEMSRSNSSDTQSGLPLACYGWRRAAPLSSSGRRSLAVLPISFEFRLTVWDPPVGALFWLAK
jgi:hypothetical protein